MRVGECKEVEIVNEGEERKEVAVSGAGATVVVDTEYEEGAEGERGGGGDKDDSNTESNFSR